jgi:hypothetical protein
MIDDAHIDAKINMILDMSKKIGTDLNAVVQRNIGVMEGVGMDPRDTVMALLLGIESYRTYLMRRDPDIGALMQEFGDLIKRGAEEMEKAQSKAAQT